MGVCVAKQARLPTDKCVVPALNSLAGNDFFFCGQRTLTDAMVNTVGSSFAASGCDATPARCSPRRGCAKCGAGEVGYQPCPGTTSCIPCEVRGAGRAEEVVAVVRAGIAACARALAARLQALPIQRRLRWWCAPQQDTTSNAPSTPALSLPPAAAQLPRQHLRRQRLHALPAGVGAHAAAARGRQRADRVHMHKVSALGALRAWVGGVAGGGGSGRVGAAPGTPPPPRKRPSRWGA